ncbi:MAG TPA: lasso peptide biosynthesis B2 protein, partial [Candidatus Saccharimonadales bacterium]|nr:lasso peptide biosynthesis B2 protein [Candidatus Saccharimonadales bacterium]
MKLRRKASTFLRLSGTDRFLICEAAIMLAVARLCVLTVPLRVLAKWLARAPDAGIGKPELVVQVRQAVETAARNVPWNAVCLPQAMAAKAMLARRGQGSAFHLG